MNISAKKKILFVMQDLEMGGAEQLKLCIQKYINKDKYVINYCCIRKIGTVGKEIIKNGGDITCLNTSDKFYNPIVIYRLYKLARKIKPNLIQSALFNANFHARIVGIFIKVPVIIEEHGMYTWKRWYHILIDKILSGFTHKIITPSKSVRDFLIAQEGISCDKIAVVYNCMDPDLLDSKTVKDEERKRLGIRGNDFTIGTVGNLRKEKGHDILLDAFKTVLTGHSNARLFIAGDGYLYDYLIKKARVLSIEKNIVFLGKRLNISGFLRALDLFVMPSLSEGLGMALLEAVYLGVPCVASEVGGLKEISEMIDGITLVRPNDAGALANAIIYKMENNIETSSSSSDKKETMGIFMPEFYIKSLEKMYNNALR